MDNKKYAILFCSIVTAIALIGCFMACYEIRKADKEHEQIIDMCGVSYPVDLGEIPLFFNDACCVNVKCTIVIVLHRYNMVREIVDKDGLLTKDAEESIRNQVVMSASQAGTLMSSREYTSSKEKQQELLNMVFDQLINGKYNIDYVDRKATIIRNTSQGNRPVYDTNTFIQQNLIRVESISFYNE